MLRFAPPWWEHSKRVLLHCRSSPLSWNFPKILTITGPALEPPQWSGSRPPSASDAFLAWASPTTFAVTSSVIDAFARHLVFEKKVKPRTALNYLSNFNSDLLDPSWSRSFCLTRGYSQQEYTAVRSRLCVQERQQKKQSPELVVQAKAQILTSAELETLSLTERRILESLSAIGLRHVALRSAKVFGEGDSFFLRVSADKRLTENDGNRVFRLDTVGGRLMSTLGDAQWLSIAKKALAKLGATPHSFRRTAAVAARLCLERDGSMDTKGPGVSVRLGWNKNCQMLNRYSQDFQQYKNIRLPELGEDLLEDLR